MTPEFAKKLREHLHTALVACVLLIFGWLFLLYAWRLVKLEPAPAPMATNPRQMVDDASASRGQRP